MKFSQVPPVGTVVFIEDKYIVVEIVKVKGKDYWWPTYLHKKSWNLFTLLIVSFDVQKLLRLIRSHLFIFAFISNILGGGS